MRSKTAPAYASPADLHTYGPYGPGRVDVSRGRNRPLYPFQGRVTADGSSGYRAEPGRYQIYAAGGCPWAQRTAIVRTLTGLDEVVSLSYADDERDARGWAFRERRGPDPVNGFTFAAATGQDAYEPWERVVTALERLDERPADRRYLHGAEITESDVRPWVALARFDLLHNPLGGISEGRLTDFANLWGYARDLYGLPAVRDTTDFSAYRAGAPPFRDGGPRRIRVEPFAAGWEAPHDREGLSA